jgi:hypothetical protein
LPSFLLGGKGRAADAADHEASTETLRVGDSPAAAVKKSKADEVDANANDAAMNVEEETKTKILEAEPSSTVHYTKPV